MATGAKRVAAKRAGRSKTTQITQGAELRPAQCRAFMRRTLAKEFRGIVDGFVKKAKSGNCQHVKLATELLETTRRDPRRRSRRVAKQWLEEVESKAGRSLEL